MSMIRFDIITIFPEPFETYFNESILGRAREKKLIDIKIWNLRDFAKVAPRRARDNFARRKIDDRPFGGGPGMVMSVEPLAKALAQALKRPTSKLLGSLASKLVVLLDAGGKQFNSKMTGDFPKKYKHIIFICGRYEGVDERIKSIIKNWKLKIVNLSVGPYVLTGGELPAMLIVDAISRHIPGVLGKNESLEEMRHGVGVPVYTRPEIFKWKGKMYTVPKVLLSGNHGKIGKWRLSHKKKNAAK